MSTVKLPVLLPILCALLLTSASAFSQLSGVVLDEQGEPLPYASVYARNSTNGTVANVSGEYKLYLTKGEHEIVFQYIGYKQKIEKITITEKAIRLNVRMEPSDLELSEVVITTEDPAYPIMRKAIEKRAYYKNRTAAYTCDTYVKGFTKLAESPKKLFGVKIGDAGGMLDSTGAGVLYLSESVSKLYVQAKPERKKEVMVSSKVSGSQGEYSLNRATLIDFSLYNERINVDRDILSPLADNAFSYYRFRLIGRYKDENGYDIYKIEVVPKRDEDPTFHGFVYIVDDWWNLAGIDLKLTGKSIQQPVLDTVRFQQEFIPVNKPDEWCLLSQVTSYKVALMGFKINGFFNSVFSNYDLRPVFGPETFNNEAFKVEKDAIRRDSSYWTEIRPIPLTEEEALDYVKKDSLEVLHTSREYLDSTDRKANRFNLGNLLFGYTWRNSYRHTQISYPSLTNGFQFNSVQGWLIDFRPAFSHADSRQRTKYWEVEGDLNYGFSEKQLRGDLRLERRFESIYYTTATLSGGTTTRQFDDRKPIGEVNNLLYSLLEKQNYLKLYEKRYFKAEASRNLFAGFQLRLSAEYADRRPLVNHSDYSLFRKDRKYWPNAPLTGISTEPESPFFDPHKAFLIQATCRIRPGETYSTYPDMRVSEGSGWPDLFITYRKAIPGVGGSTVDFDQVQFNLQQRHLPLGLFGYTEWNAGGGLFWRRRMIEFMDFYHPMGNQTLIGKPENYSKGFFLLPYYEFSTSDAWAEGHLYHHFNGWLLDKVPGLRKLNWKETLGIGAYYATQFAAEDQRPTTTLPYWELSFGFENIGYRFLRPLHINVAVGFLGSEYYRTGVVLGLSL